MAVPLVAYSDSDSDSADLEQQAHVTSGQKRKRRGASLEHEQPSKKRIESKPPPLPASFHNLYVTNARLSTRDDPDLHGGRQRITPHVEGNWPSHVYLECESRACYATGRKRDHLIRYKGTLQ
jgi:U6 snRNA phosphodiesterase